MKSSTDLHIAQEVQKWLEGHIEIPQLRSVHTEDSEAKKEHILAKRFSKLRVKARDGKAHPDAVRILDGCIPGWVHLKERKSQLQSAEEYVTFLADHEGRHPSREAMDEKEKALGAFIHNMKFKNLRSSERRTACKEAVDVLIGVGALPPDSWDKYTGKSSPGAGRSAQVVTVRASP